MVGDDSGADQGYRKSVPPSGLSSVGVDPNGSPAWNTSGVPLGLFPAFWNGNVPGSRPFWNKMTIYGYARVSTLNQDLTIQRAALKAAGCTVVRAEKASGSRRDGRTELQVLLDFVQPGDTLVVTRIDRLARSMKDLQDIVHELKGTRRGAARDRAARDTGTAAGKAFLDMLGVFAEFETNLRRERQLEGIALAKTRGVYKGRKPSVDIAEVRRLRHEEKLGPAAIARRLGIGRTSVYRALEGAMVAGRV